jgi:hypothetical protein
MDQWTAPRIHLSDLGFDESDLQDRTYSTN